MKRIANKILSQKKGKNNKIRAEINEIEAKKKIERSMKLKADSLKR